MSVISNGKAEVAFVKLNQPSDWLAFFESFQSLGTDWGIWEYCDPDNDTSHEKSRPKEPEPAPRQEPPVPPELTRDNERDWLLLEKQYNLALANFTVKRDMTRDDERAAHEQYKLRLDQWLKRDKRIERLNDYIRVAVSATYTVCIKDKATAKEKLKALKAYIAPRLDQDKQEAKKTYRMIMAETGQKD